MKKSKIMQVSGAGTWKEFNKFEVVLEDGKKGTYYCNSDQEISIKVGDEIHYKINDKGTLQVLDPNDLPVPDSMRQLLIVRQSCVKASIDYLVSTGRPVSEDEVLEMADKFKNYVYEGLKNQ